MLGDKAYSSRGNRALLRSRGITAVIAETVRPDRRTASAGAPAGGRPPAFDAEAYKGRNVIERSFNVLKQWRGLATRYDKLALTYRGGVVLARHHHLATRIGRHALAATPPSIYGGSARPSALRAISRITHLPPTASRRMNPHLGT